jgi:hypothetical protein
MSSANLNDRSSLERIYPRDAFEQDAGENSRAKASILKGIRILSPPDDSGAFELARASQHVGEGDPEGDTLFLAPYLGDEYAALQRMDTAYGGPEEKGDALAKVEPRGDYEAFIGKVLQAARSAEFKKPIGKGEERLRGFHGG